MKLQNLLKFTVIGHLSLLNHIQDWGEYQIYEYEYKYEYL